MYAYHVFQGWHDSYASAKGSVCLSSCDYSLLWATRSNRGEIWRCLDVVDWAAYESADHIFRDDHDTVVIGYLSSTVHC